MDNIMHLPCGGEANFDHGAGYGYRCELCSAVLGSVGQPRSCRTEADKWDAYEKAGLWRWNYTTGQPEIIQPSKSVTDPA
jgi:hypothetical protein